MKEIRNSRLLKTLIWALGGYMAMRIGQELGRDALVQTIEEGLFSFVDTYNTIAEEDMQVVYTLQGS